MRQQRGFLRPVMVTALPVLLIFFSGPAFSQRCGGTFDYLVRDTKGKIISASEVTITVAPTNGYENGGVGRWSYRSTHAFMGDRNKPLAYEPESFIFGTGCGRPMIDAVLEYQGLKMSLHFKNVPPEWNFYVDSLPFQAGDFEIDLGPIFEPSYHYNTTVSPSQLVKQMSDEEKDKNIFLKELKGCVVISGSEWKRVKK